MESRLAPPRIGRESLAPEGPSGVRTPGRRAYRLLARVGLALCCVSLLGQGERLRVDPRFATPSATLNTYWSALGQGKVEDVWECFVEGRNDLPVPGMLWFLPPMERLELGAFHSLPVTRGHVLVSYEVRYVPRGLRRECSFRTRDELVRMRGAWRIARPVGLASFPAFPYPPRPIDI